MWREVLRILARAKSVRSHAVSTLMPAVHTEPDTADHDAMTRLDTAAQHFSSGPGAAAEGA